MSGLISNLQIFVKQNYAESKILFVYCLAHRLNLVLKITVKYKKEITSFFQNLLGFTTFFKNPANKIKVLDRKVKKRFTRLRNTRSNYESRMIDVIFIINLNCPDISSHCDKTVRSELPKYDLVHLIISETCEL